MKVCAPYHMYAVRYTVCFNICMYLGLSLQAAMCYIHIAALIAEYLKRKGKINIQNQLCIYKRYY